jgi:hypothetical protein
MDALYDLTTNSKYDDSTKLKLSYNILKGVSKYYKPTFKMYLNKHVRGQIFSRLDSADWDTALFLTTRARFRKVIPTVWKDSRAEIRGR